MATNQKYTGHTNTVTRHSHVASGVFLKQSDYIKQRELSIGCKYLSLEGTNIFKCGCNKCEVMHALRYQHQVFF